MKPEEYHRQTEHTWTSVRAGPAMDWRLQPEVYKRYPPEFARLPLHSVPVISQFLQLGAGVTATRIFPGGRYSLRAQPSAGALYPCELYLQAREVDGIADGLYHYQPDTNELCLLSGLGGGGFEAVLPDTRKVNGVILLISALYYRSSWKYRDRALRYCMLDSGHLAGALEAAALCLNLSFSIYLDIDRERVGSCLDFRDRELPVAVIVCGTRNDERISQCGISVGYAEGTGIFSQRSFIIDGFRASAAELCPGNPGSTFHYGVKASELSAAINRRRSIRRFRGIPLKKTEYEGVQQVLEASFPLDCCGKHEIFSVVNRVNGIEPGLYFQGTLLRRGDFTGKAGYLCLEQSLCAASGLTLFITAAEKGYLQNMFSSGVLGQRIYLQATLLGCGCSGIGAFYDREVAAFLNTKNKILYALVVGH